MSPLDHETVGAFSIAEIAPEFEDMGFRQGYMAHRLRVFLADQIRALRGNMTQKEFGEKIRKPQSVISRLENEDDSGISFETLLDIAKSLDIAFIGQFVDYPTFLKITRDTSDHALAPREYNTTRPEIAEMERRDAHLWIKQNKASEDDISEKVIDISGRPSWSIMNQKASAA